MVDICPFKAQERMNNVCKNNYFSPRTKQSYTKLSKLEDTNKKGCPRFPEQPLLFSFYTSVLIFNSTYTYAVPIRFGKHVTYALTFGSDTRSIDFVHSSKSFCKPLICRLAVFNSPSLLFTSERRALIEEFSPSISAWL